MKDQIANRSRKISIEVYKLCKQLEKGLDQNVLGYQLLRSASSFAANYRAACRARSKKEFIAKLSICIEESDETLFWLDFLVDAGVVEIEKIDWLRRETDEMLAIFTSSKKTALKNLIEDQNKL